MRKKILYILAVVGLLAGFFCFIWKPQGFKPMKLTPALPSLSMPHLPAPKHGISLMPGSYTQLPGWERGDLKQSLRALRISCHAFLRQNPNDSVGSQYIRLKVKDWYPACNAAARVDDESGSEVKTYFQTWFKPVEFQQGKPIQGLFTGYYVPSLQGSLTKSHHFSVPIYAVPKNLVTANLSDFSQTLPHHKLVGHVVSKKMIPFYTRAEIDKGAIAGVAQVLAWVSNSLDRLVLETEGSGVIELQDGGQLAVGYAADNGAKYHSIASILIQRGSMSADDASIPHIRSYFKQHPTQFRPIINQNKSFVFFHQLPEHVVLGSQGVPLTPGYSLAVDRQWIPMGVPLWLTTTVSDAQTKAPKSFNRLMVAQDTGGSIRGMVRGDIYWGHGKEATAIATKTKSTGRYWLFLPKRQRA